MDPRLSRASNSAPSALNEPPPEPCTRRTRRYCLVIINLLVLCVGLFFLGAGVIVKTQYNNAAIFNTTLIGAKSAENFKNIAEAYPPSPPPLIPSISIVV